MPDRIPAAVSHLRRGDFTCARHLAVDRVWALLLGAGADHERFAQACDLAMDELRLLRDEAAAIAAVTSLTPPRPGPAVSEGPSPG